jgi:hypothetical protein
MQYLAFKDAARGISLQQTTLQSRLEKKLEEEMWTGLST